MNRLIIVVLLLAGAGVSAQENTNQNPFRQLYDQLPTPNVYRTASGAPGHQYYQQEADYEMDIKLDEEEHRIEGTETITYTNNSPDPLRYLWVQLDQNVRSPDAKSDKVSTGQMPDKMSLRRLQNMHKEFPGGFKIDYVRDKRGDALDHTINYTMMRVDMPEVLESGDDYTFRIKWSYNINNRMKEGGRSGFENFEENDNALYTIAQFYPRMAVYNETEGWQNKQFLGRGEFALPFGDFEVNITLPDDHVVRATGQLQNPNDVLTDKQQDRLEKARNSYDEPVFVVNEEEAIANQQTKSESTQTWEFEAENVRDFAFAASRKFIWDAMGVKFGDRTVLAQSVYPEEGNPLWERYSTEVVAHTLKTYSHYTIEYPYPQATSVHAKRMGMEYPMICFNFGRPEEDDTYSERTKYGMISVIIHEVGHNFFPMIVNSDERQWTWMDEGLNTFVQYLTEQEWERDYPSRRGPPAKITSYMEGDKDNIMPIMTNSESIYQFGNNAYGKPATALNILRETVMGRELFDFAFKTYAQRWQFKHPTPADFFRTMEDASSVDLDWFFRGWFYTTDHVDIALKDVKWYKANPRDPEAAKKVAKEKDEDDPRYIGNIRNEKAFRTITEKDSATRDFYTKQDPYEVTVLEKEEYQDFREDLTEAEKALLAKDHNYYEMTFENLGGLVMPIILEFEYKNGETEVVRIPAQIWRKNDEQVSKVFTREREIVRVTLDPFLETADVDRGNNYWPERKVPSRFEIFKRQQRESGKNDMQRQQESEED